MSVITLAFIAGHLILLGYVYIRGQRGRNWLMASIIFALLAATTYLLPEDMVVAGGAKRGLLLIITLLASLIAFGGLVIIDLGKAQLLRGWVGLGSAWIAAMILVGTLDQTFMVGQPNWTLEIFRQPDTSILIAALGMIVTGITLFGMTLQNFYQAKLPESANRTLYWAITSFMMVFGILLTGSAVDFIAVLGMITMLAALIGAVYAENSYRVFDIRNAIILSIRTLFFVAFSSAMIFTALYLAVTTGLEGDVEGLLTMAAIALLLSVLYVPIRQITEYAMRQLMVNSNPEPAFVTREYSQVVSEVVDLNALLVKTTSTLNRVMRIRTSALILLSSTLKFKDAVELTVMTPDPQNRATGVLYISSPIYDVMAAQQKAITQFDIEYAPQFTPAPDEERAFFKSLQMSVYAPIILDNVLIGILACGAKLNDTAYYKRDLELLTTLARQTGVALRNARLVDDLQHLNTSMRSLNRTLKQANDQLGRMDSVKSDFVTIASHELRTPLAQIRGYTDIVEALNEQGMLNPEQTQTLVGNLRKATERMEELISAMLDVSQLDVDAMDLRFTPTSIETVVKMAIEPLTDPIRMRKLNLTVRGTRGLPMIQADLQRLVQAFRNVFVNAIKFTPDTGKIEITASLEKSETEDDKDQIIIQISDTGVGIDKQNLEMVFKKFFRAYDPSLHSTGTYKFLGAGPGLGLTIARGVIEGHGGKIWAESDGHDMENYPGTSFYIRLPVSTPESARRVLTFEGDAAAKALNQPPAMTRETRGRKEMVQGEAT